MIPTSSPCACREQRIPYGSRVAIDENGEHHYASYCASQRIEVKPDPAPAPSWRLLSTTCPEHNEAIWATGEDPVGLLAELGCPCSERVA